MLRLPQPLDWNRLRHLSTQITWQADTYQYFERDPIRTGEITEPGTEWESLPFDESQLGKFPERGGFYAFSFTYACLGFPKQEIILYVGEAANLRNRLSQHFETAKTKPKALANADQLTDHTSRLAHLFTTFQQLTVRYCAITLPQEERRDLERNLISLLDPPYNLRSRAKPARVPVIEPPSGLIATTAKAAKPAFETRDSRSGR